MPKAPGLEAVLAGRCDSPYSLSEFINFLKKSCCYENYDFLLEMDTYDQLNSDCDRREAWLRLLKTFIMLCSDFEINLNGDLRSRLLGNFDIISTDYTTPEGLATLQLPNERDLKEAREETRILLKDAYLQFLKSVDNHEDNKRYVDKFKMYEDHTAFASEINVLIGGNYCLANESAKSISSDSVTDLPGLDDFVKGLQKKQSPLDKKTQSKTAAPVPPSDMIPRQVRRERKSVVFGREGTLRKVLKSIF